MEKIKIKEVIQNQKNEISIDDNFKKNLGIMLQNQIQYLSNQSTQVQESLDLSGNQKDYEGLSQEFTTQSLDSSSGSSEINKLNDLQNQASNGLEQLPLGENTQNAQNSQSLKRGFGFFNKRFRLFMAYSFTLVFLLLVGLTLFQLSTQEGNGGIVAEVEDENKPSELVALDFGDVKIEANEKVQETLVATTSSFLLKSEKKIDSAKLKDSINIEPFVEYEIKQNSDTEYMIVPKNPLEEGQIYNIEVATSDSEEILSWAFQVKESFKVNSTTPADKSNLVDPNTGIEVEFSSPNLPENIQDYIKIEPTIDYSVERLSKLLIIKPNSTLEFQKVYSVTISSEITDTITGEKLLGGDYIFRFETNNIYDENQDTSYIEFNRRFYEYPTSSDEFIFDISSSVSNKYNDNGLVDVILYGYSSEEEFVSHLNQITNNPVWAYYRNNNQVKPLEGQSVVRSYNGIALTELNPELGFFSRIFTLPNSDKLPKGNYFLEATYGGGLKATSFLQVTNLSTYYNTTQTKTLFWVNSLENTEESKSKVTITELSTNATISEVEITNSPSSEGDGSTSGGVVVFDTPENVKNREVGLVKLSNATDSLYVALTGNDSIYYSYYGYGSYLPNSEASKYWSQLYHDKNTYAQTDKINIFGVLDSRDGNEIDWNKVKVQLYDRNGYSNFNSEVFKVDENFVIKTAQVEHDDNNTFNAVIELNEMRSNYYQLLLTYNGALIRSDSIKIFPYELPPYKVEAELSSSIVKIGDTMTVTGNIKTYSGIPVPNLPLEINWSDSKTVVSTDELGKFETSFTISDNIIDYFKNQSLSTNGVVYITNADLAEGEVFYSLPFITTNSSVFLNAERIYDSEIGESVKFSLTGTNINFGSKESFSYSNLYDFDSSPFFQGVTDNKKVIVKVEEYFQEREQKGTNYNYITKVNEPVYTYSSRLVETRELSFELDEEGKAIVEIPLSSKENTYSDVIFSLNDNEGRPSNYKYFNISSNVSNDYFSVSKLSDAYFLETDLPNNKFSSDQKANISFSSQRNEVESQNNSFLIIEQRGGYRGHYLSKSSSIERDLGKSQAPNVYYSGVVFNGRTYFITRDIELEYDYSKEVLDVVISSDKEEYAPNEKVNLKVEVKDVRGEAVADSSVAVVIVDQAIRDFESKGMNYANTGSSGFVNEIYKSTLPGEIDENASHFIPELANEIGGKGSMGAGEPRSDFDDNLGIFVAKTDTNGIANIEITLSDSITTWDVYSMAYKNVEFNGNDQFGNPVVSQLPLVGEVNTKILSQKEFYIDSVIPDRYLINDNPIISLKNFGTNETEGEVIYSIVSESLGINQEVEGSYQGQVDFPLGDLKEGRHEIKISGKFILDGKELTDSIVRLITVESQNQSQLKISEPEKLTTTYKPQYSEERGEGKYFDLVFSNSSSAKYLNELKALESNVLDNFETRLASKIAKEILSSEFGEKNYSSNDNLNDFVKDKSTVATTLNSDTSLELTALALNYNSDYLNTNLTEDYFKKIYFDINESKERQAIALYGLSLLDVAVKDGVYRLLQEKDLDIKSRLYLILALNELGDRQEAEKIFNGIIETNSIELSKTQLVLRNDVDEEDEVLDYQLTRLALLISGDLNHEIGEKLLNYLSANSSIYSVSSLERALYVEKEIGRSKPSESSFVLKTEKGKKDVKLIGNQSFTISIQNSKENLDGFAVESVSGDVSVSLLELVPYEVMKSQSQRVSVNKRYFVNDIETNEFNSTDLVKVVLTYSIPEEKQEGCYKINDNLPSGLALISSEKQIQDDSYFNSDGSSKEEIKSYRIYSSVGDTSKVEACVYENGYELIYYARAVNKGDFIDEGAFIFDMVNNEFSKSDEKSVKIN